MTNIQNRLNSENAAGVYIIIGSGRLSHHLQHYFKLLRISFTTWNRHQDISLLNQHLEARPKVLLAISDQALELFYRTYLEKLNLSVIHFSGAFDHPKMISCHPLMTFTPELYDLDFYKSLHFAVTGASHLQEVIPELPNPSFHLHAKDKAVYHAWCVLSAAGAQTLWQASLEQLQSLGAPEKAVTEYIKKIAENFTQNPHGSMTGPWVRKDETTIQKNREALPTESARNVYELLRKGLL